ncbi:MAG: redox-regulated ATPase YchF [Candidatus Aminicenantes bacterium]|jgi:GTP-binding protein YchF|nr:redox-regulated ATPase YchF [Candidatus Aminicenantes bacterium]
MVIALFGYSSSGKTTLLEILSHKKSEIHRSMPETRMEIPRAICPVPDSRLDQLASIYPGKNKVPVQIEVEDFPGLAGSQISASQYLSQLRKADGLIHVVRAFQDPALPHPRGKIDPAADIKAMSEELIFSDLVMVTQRLEKLEKDLKKVKDTETEKEKLLLEKLKPVLEQGQAIRQVPLTPSEEKMLRGFCFISLKPILHIINLDEKDLAFLEHLRERYPAIDPNITLSSFCGRIEKELGELEEEDRKIFMGTYGLEETAPVRFFRQIYEIMELVNFYTIGKDEVRAWSVKKNTPAVKAAGEIHSDLEKGFIRAEVISLEELLKFGSWQKAKEAGVLRLEGRDYPVQNGDVIYFRFSQ